MKTEMIIRHSIGRAKNWIISLLLLAACFIAYEVVTELSKTPLPITKPVVDATGTACYKYIAPVSVQNRTYLMAVSYTHGFAETQERFKVYYVWYKDLYSAPLRAVVYDGSYQLSDVTQVRFYRENTQATSPITVVLSVNQQNQPTKTWRFTPPQVFPRELEEDIIEKEGFRQYHDWYPPFD